MTNLKQHLSSRGRGEEVTTADCQLCHRPENTLHIVFECENYSEKIWQALGNIITHIENVRITLHAYNIMYNLDIKGISPTKNEQVLYLIQEIKRNLILRRYIRSTTGSGLTYYNLSRISSHLLITVRKSLYQRQTEGYSHEYLKDIQARIIEEI